METESEANITSIEFGELLGESPNLEKQNNNDSIMITLTVPNNYMNKNISYKKYEIMTPYEQRNIIYLNLIKLISHINLIDLWKEDFKLHYETHKSGNIHAHAVIKIKDIYFGYDLHLITMEKVWRQLIKGNQYSGKFKWCFDNIQAYKYVDKQNIFEPDIISINFNKYIINI